MGKQSRRRWTVSLLGLGMALLVSDLARDPLSAFPLTRTHADRELEKIRREHARQQRELTDLSRSGSAEDIETAERRFAAQANERRARSMEIADHNPGTYAKAVALLFVADQWPESSEGTQAFERLIAAVDEIEIGAWVRALNDVQMRTDGNDRWRPLAAKLVERLQAKPDDPGAALLAAKACGLVAPDTYVESAPEEFVALAELIRKHYATSPDIYNFSEYVGGTSGYAPAWGAEFEPHVRHILEVNEDRFVRCTAKFALASIARAGGIERQTEAEQLLEEFLTEFDGKTEYPASSVEELKRQFARRILKSIRSHGLSMPAPKTVGIDLKGRPMSLADYRGKVVLVSFWATWCAPCMQAIPHEKKLLERFGADDFAIVGVNADKKPSRALEAVAKHGIDWRSFQAKPDGGSSIADDWHIAGYPTYYLLDREGVVARTWRETPPASHLEIAIETLLKPADR